MTEPLSHVYRAFLNQGIFPNRLKFATVKPIFKKGEKTDVANYRPISLITTFAKILENIMYSRLRQHLTVNKVLTPEQFGIRKNSNTYRAIYTITINILTTLNEHSQTVGIFCDTTKAFDSVNHIIILVKLCHYSIHSTVLLWLRPYLQKRRQRIQILHNEFDKTSSGWETLKNGAPQGSILGPLLSLLDIKDLPLEINIDSKLI